MYARSVLHQLGKKDPRPVPGFWGLGLGFRVYRNCIGFGSLSFDLSFDRKFLVLICPKPVWCLRSGLVVIFGCSRPV